MKVLLVGDSHMNANFIYKAFQLAEQEQVQLIIQLGDFGFWDEPITHDPKTMNFAEVCDSFTRHFNIPLWVVEGNHDDPKVYERYRLADFSTENQIACLTWIPRGETITIDGVKVGFFGGAVSVDYGFREPGYDWWVEELATDEQCAYAASKGPIDIWLTHDAVDVPYNRQVLKFGDIVDMRISIQRHLLSRLRYDLKPKIHVHGHWHHDYHISIPIDDDHRTYTYGLRHESLKSGLMVAEIGPQEDGSIFKVLRWKK